MMTLREQVKELGARTFNSAAVQGVTWPELVKRLAAEAFQRRWDERKEKERDCRVVRVALGLLEKNGVVGADEMGVK